VHRVVFGDSYHVAFELSHSNYRSINKEPYMMLFASKYALYAPASFERYLRKNKHAHISLSISTVVVDSSLQLAYVGLQILRFRTDGAMVLPLWHLLIGFASSTNIQLQYDCTSSNGLLTGLLFVILIEY
jgi:hypothetical protein